MVTISFLNGFYKGADFKGLSNLEQVDNTIFEANSEGQPFRGKPLDMASDALSHINSKFLPIIIESWGGCDNRGYYTTKVVFQAVRLPF